MFTRNLFFEVTEDGAELATGGADAEVTDSTDTTAADTSAAETTTEAPAGIDFSSPEFQQAVAQYSEQYGGAAAEAYVNDLIAQHEAEQAQQYELPEFDPTNPDGFAEGLLGAFDQRLQAALEPLNSAMQQAQLSEASQQADSMAASQPEVAAISELLPEDKRDGVSQTIRALAEGFLPAASEQYGNTPQAAQAAMRAASAHMFDLSKAAHEAGKQAYIAEMKGVSDAARTPQAGGDGVQTVPAARDEEEFAFQWAQRNGNG